MKNILAILLCLSAIYGLTSCAPKKSPFERHHFIIEANRDLGTASEQIPGTLTIRNFSVSPGYQGKEMVYRTKKNKAHADFYNHYFILPGPMISQVAREWFRDAGLFSSVVPPASNKEADFILEGTINSIFGDFRNKVDPKAVLDMDFLLLKDTGLEFEVIFQKNYRAEHKMADRSAQELINSFNKSLLEILMSLENDMLVLYCPRNNSDSY
ncbi:MAG: hypothetical protein D5R98_08230 [Desulfonatronovibrio sp. MSAO_Bac4]|nr:MAG: hypothetical protein D5R98_08230 [Desulfonatronovibrio sp. MSAO_Bac4]